MNQNQPKTKIKAIKKELPYKKSRLSLQVAENVEKATAQFITTCPRETSKYEMIIVATARSRDLFRGATPMVEGDHRPLVTALLEIEAGKVNSEYKQS